MYNRYFVSSDFKVVRTSIEDFRRKRSGSLSKDVGSIEEGTEGGLDDGGDSGDEI